MKRESFIYYGETFKDGGFIARAGVWSDTRAGISDAIECALRNGNGHGVARSRRPLNCVSGRKVRAGVEILVRSEMP